MRRVTALTLAAAALAAGWSHAASASATEDRITDIRGDANGADLREEGVSAADDVAVGPATVDEVDVLAAQLAPGHLVVRLAGPVGALPLQRTFTVTLVTARCATVTLTWSSESDGTRMHGCHWIQDVWLPSAKVAGTDLVLPLPATWPRWLPAGTPVSRITVQSHGMLELGAPGGLGVGALYVGGDYATGAVAAVLR